MAAVLANRSRYIPLLFVAGFAVVIAVNGVMIWLAVSSFSGLYTPQPRERDLHFNDLVAEQRNRDALGWRIDAAWSPAARQLQVTVSDSTGRPLSGAHVAVELIRPVEKRPPLGVAMEAVDIGRFAGGIELPELGNWDVDILVERGADRYALTRRMFLR